MIGIQGIVEAAGATSIRRVSSGCSAAGSMTAYLWLSNSRNQRSSRTSTLDGCTIAGSNALLQSNLRDGYAASKPASAILYLAPFETSLVETVRDLRGVADAEGRRSLTVVLTTADGRDR